MRGGRREVDGRGEGAISAQRGDHDVGIFPVKRNTNHRKCELGQSS